MKLLQQTFCVFLFLSITLNKTNAQLCQGSLGDAVVNITFGAGENPGQALSSTITNYNFVSNFCPDDGMYTIARSTADCFGSSWYTLTEDHTPGDINGYMMIVNASFAPGDFYVQTVNGLCENTTYEFAAWILNIIRSNTCGGPIKPNVTFNIETISGTVLQSYKTGDIAATSAPEWKHYGSFFTTPAGTTSIVIRLTNNAPGGCGNDLILDDITFRPCGPLATVSINGSLKSVDVCSGNISPFTFTADISPGYNNPLYQWQVSNNGGVTWTDIIGANKSTYLRTPVISPGVYQYRLAVAQGNNISLPSCRIVSDVVTINVNPIPVPAAFNNGPVCEGEMLTLKANDGITFLWRGPQNFISDEQSPSIANATVNNTGKYYVNVTSDKGCKNTDSTVGIINISPVANAGNDAEICEGKTTLLQGTGSNIISYNWNPPASLSDNRIPDPVASPAETTMYILTAINGTCKNADSVTIRVIKKPTANAGSDKIIIRNQSVTLTGVAGGTNVSWLWTPDLYMSSPLSISPVVMPPTNISYVLHVQSNSGCGTAIDTVLIKVYNDLFIPNAFTPNNDGKNDTWNIETLGAYKNAEIKVFNRYGEIVYSNNSVKNQWDGKYKGVLQTPGVYCYIIDLKNGMAPLSGVVLIIL